METACGQEQASTQPGRAPAWPLLETAAMARKLSDVNLCCLETVCEHECVSVCHAQV